MFRPVNDETIAQIMNRVDEGMKRQARLSAQSSAVSAASSAQSVDKDNDRPQPMVVDETDLSSQAAANRS